MLKPSLNRRPVARGARLATMALALALTASVAGFQAAAQTFGGVSGSVVDATNRAISGATLVLTRVQNEAKHEVRSDAGGHFDFVGLPPGAYRFGALAIGFAPFRDELIVVAGRSLQQTVTLQVGSLTETVTVSGRDASRESVDGPRPRRFVDRTSRGSSACVSTAAGGNIEPPTKIGDARPAYPALMRENSIAGSVVLEGRISIDGSFRDLRVVSPPHPDFDAAALEAVRQWQFTETLLNCVPVEVTMTVTVNFVPQP